MGKLIQKLNWDMSFIKNQCTFVYADADLDSNQKMQDLVFFLILPFAYFSAGN